MFFEGQSCFEGTCASSEPYVRTMSMCLSYGNLTGSPTCKIKIHLLFSALVGFMLRVRDGGCEASGSWPRAVNPEFSEQEDGQDGESVCFGASAACCFVSRSLHSQVAGAVNGTPGFHQAMRRCMRWKILVWGFGFELDGEL